MRMSAKEFLAWPNKAITLLGMSGIGKTTLAYKLPKSKWFHYSGDYRKAGMINVCEPPRIAGHARSCTDVAA